MAKLSDLIYRHPLVSTLVIASVLQISSNIAESYRIKMFWEYHRGYEDGIRNKRDMEGFQKDGPQELLEELKKEVDEENKKKEDLEKALRTV